MLGFRPPGCFNHLRTVLLQRWAQDRSRSEVRCQRMVARLGVNTPWGPVLITPTNEEKDPSFESDKKNIWSSKNIILQFSSLLESVLWIRIWVRIRSDPKLLSGSGSEQLRIRNKFEVKLLWKTGTIWQFLRMLNCRIQNQLKSSIRIRKKSFRIHNTDQNILQFKPSLFLLKQTLGSNPAQGI